MSNQQYQSLSTTLIHGGEVPDSQTGAIAPILVRSKTFKQPVFGQEATWQYSRGKNPTRSILEHKLESLLPSGKATVFGSGDAATTMFLLTLKPGDHIICCDELYGGTIRLFDQLFAEFGIKTSYVNFNNEHLIRSAKTDNTVAIWVESPTNPKLGIIDLAHIGKIARDLDIRFIADLTFAPPCTTNPFDYGIETVIYSLSKYFGGHNDVIGGAVVTQNQQVHDRLCWLQWSVGAVLSPDECYRLIQELKTLEIRWLRVSQTAQIVAEYLSSNKSIERVYFPGLASHKGNEIASNQMKNGFGSVVSFNLKTKSEQIIKQFVDDLQETGIVIFAESLSSPETILSHPASMSHRSLTQQQRNELAIDINFFRLSVGLEDPQDIIMALSGSLPS